MVEYKGAFNTINALLKDFSFSFDLEEAKKRCKANKESKKKNVIGKMRWNKDVDFTEVMKEMADEALVMVQQEATRLDVQSKEENGLKCKIEDFVVREVYYNGGIRAVIFVFKVPGVKIWFGMRERVTSLKDLERIMEDVVEHLDIAVDSYATGDYNEMLYGDPEYFWVLQGVTSGHTPFNDSAYKHVETEKSLNEAYELEDYDFDSESEDEASDQPNPKKIKTEEEKKRVYPKPWPNKKDEWGFRIKECVPEEIFDEYCKK